MNIVACKRLYVRATLLFALATPVLAQTNTDSGKAVPALQDAVILIVRHAEKPESGFGLSAPGVQRAEAYADYFKNLTLDSQPLKPDYLFATADSEKSHRQRLTLEPLSKTLGLKIDTRFKNKDFAKLAEEIRSKNHGRHILIAWHHGEIPELAHALGIEPAQLLPGGKWPTDTFNWLLELRFDHEGRLLPAQSKRIVEHLMPGDSDK